MHTHIPASDTQAIEILSFEESRKQHGNLTYNSKKWIYIPDFYSEYRYILGTTGNLPLITIGINPSTASPEQLDNTLKSVQRIASRNGFDSFIMLNLYAQRATRPNDLDKLCNYDLHKENVAAFRWIFENYPAPLSIWAAWGTTIEKRSYLRFCLQDIVKEGKSVSVKWYTAGELTKHGHPHHPLYLKENTRIVPFDIEKYLNSEF